MIVLGAGWTLSRFNFEHVRWELRSRQIVHADMVELLNDPAVAAGRRCGPVTVPNHKLVPDVRYLLDAGEGDVVPRTRMPKAGQATRGAWRCSSPAGGASSPIPPTARSTSSTTTR